MSYMDFYDLDFNATIFEYELKNIDEIVLMPYEFSLWVIGRYKKKMKG